jgi:hypothetical protein
MLKIEILEFQFYKIKTMEMENNIYIKFLHESLESYKIGEDRNCLLQLCKNLGGLLSLKESIEKFNEDCANEELKNKLNNIYMIHLIIIRETFSFEEGEEIPLWI